MNSLVKLLIALFAVSGASLSSAQVNTCKRPNGTTFQSYQACPPPAFAQYGTQPTTPPEPTYSRSYESSRYDSNRQRPAGAELKYMSTECSSLSEGIRTGPARGVKYDVISQLQREFEEKCRDNHSDALKTLYNEKNDKKQSALADKQSAMQAAAQSKEERDQRLVQCAEMRKALANRRAKTELSDGEKADIVVFEQRFQSRCS